jgi:hypothetical protein
VRRAKAHFERAPKKNNFAFDRGDRGAERAHVITG